MELRHLRTFLVVVEEGSVSAAARRLFVAQPALTRQVTALERQFGTALFDRLPGGMGLTAAGRELLPQARRLVALADAIVDRARDGARPGGAHLVVGVLEEGLNVLTPVVVAAFRAAHPDVAVRLVPCGFDDLAALADRRGSRLDAVIWGVDHPPPGTEGHAVYAEPLQLFAGPASRYAGATAVSPVDLLDEPFVDCDALLRAQMQPFHLTEVRNGAPPRYSRQAYNAPLDVFAAVGRGEGYVAATPGTPDYDLSLSRVPFDRVLKADVGLLAASGESRHHVRDFISLAVELGHTLLDLVPGALPPRSAGAMPIRH